VVDDSGGASMIERRYHIKDMIALLGLNPKSEGAREITKQLCPDRRKGEVYRPLGYSDEFQAWFRAGLRECRLHPYPFVWHIMRGLECPKCAEERASVSKFYILPLP
jgi:hypothetical protein